MSRSVTARQAVEQECRLVSSCRSLLDSMPSMFDDASLSDITFVVGRKRELHAHRQRLRGSLDFSEAQLYGVVTRRRGTSL